jgi:transposase
MDQQERADPPRGLTVPEVAQRYRVGEDKVRSWIRRGELKAINTATVLCGRPRWVILPNALAAFERSRASTPPPKPARRRRQVDVIDYFPDY